MTVEYPERDQEAPNYWDNQLKMYINDAPRRMLQTPDSEAQAAALNVVKDDLEKGEGSVLGPVVTAQNLAQIEAEVPGMIETEVPVLVAPGLAAAQRAAQLRPRDVTPYPSPPTLTYSLDASPPIASAALWGLMDGPCRLLSCAPVLVNGNPESGYVKNTVGPTDLDINRSPYQVETVSDGDFALRGRAFASSPLPRVNLYIDGRPCQSDPQVVSGISLSTGTNYYTLIPHPAPGVPLDFRVQIAGMGLRRLEAAPGTTLQRPTKPRPKIAIFGTSYSHNTGSTARYLYSWVWALGELLGAEIYNFARSGAGYIGDGSNTIAAQIARATELGINPDLWIAEGSGNDVPNSAGAVGAAAAAAFASLADLWPTVPGIVIGMGARGSNGETGDVAANVITGTRNAALAAATVIGFHDPIGTVTSMPTYTTGAAYSAGQVVKVIGSAARARAVIASAPATVDRTSWELLSHLYGTGYVGATTGDGNRDTAVDADAVHPTAKGARLMAARYIGWIIEDLRKVLEPA